MQEHQINDFKTAGENCCFCWLLQGLTGEGSAIDLDMGPSIDAAASKNYRSIKQVLERLTKLCVQSSPSGNKPRKHEQRLLRNMGAHSVVLELLQIPYEKVGFPCNLFVSVERSNRGASWSQ